MTGGLARGGRWRAAKLVGFDPAPEVVEAVLGKVELPRRGLVASFACLACRAEVPIL